MKKAYITFPTVIKRIEFAQSMNSAVYIYGATGYGKTKLVEEYLKGKKATWFLAGDTECDFTDVLETQTQETRIIVVDNLQFLRNEESRRQIFEMANREDIWLILMGRTPSPKWLIPLLAEGQLLVIKEEQLRFSSTEISIMAERMGLSLSKEVLDELALVSAGNAYAISITLQMISSGESFDMELAEKVKNLFADYLEENIIPQWSVVIQDFLMKISVVDTFTLELATMITGDDQAAAVIEEAVSVGNFIKKSGDIIRISEVLCKALRNKAVKTLGLNEYKNYICNAGHYYEMHDDIISALELYQRAEATDYIRNLLIRNGRRHPGIGHYYELRFYYMALEEKDVANSAILMSALSMLYSVLLNVEKSEYWYRKLQEYSKKLKAGERREADELLLYLDIALPHRGSVDIKDLIIRTASLIRTGGISLPEMSVTNNEPSTMSGGKDFCQWSKNDTIIADTIGKTVEKLLGNYGRGLVNAALCESFYEKGGRDSEVSHLAMLSQMEVEGGGRLEIMFATVGIQSRLNMINGKKSNTLLMLNAFEDRLKREKNESIRPSLNALRCRLALMAGDEVVVDEWMKEAPNELVDFCVLERYRYMTKVLCYLSRGQNREAINLLDKMLCYAKMYSRTYIYIDASLLMSIALKREKEEWKEHFMECLAITSEYKFVRVISEKGAGVLPLLKEIKNDYLKTKGVDSAWFNRVKKETEMIAERYPAYLSSEGVQPSDFSDIAMSILRMQSEGYSIKEIADHHDLSERTIKYHAAENYRKLNAKGKTDAVQKARNMNLI